ncbi:hypothetical protein B0H16DRAFT_630797 [Mycena metata]|uniref:Uncharacterized protein n=1 Tax=Mycena metata TaxID=1033252 RepID=A0AAD7NGQ2_9AGAR|nr:hypothetical protein B0H16DRAFT_630797 [Mycena metata]
MVSCTGSDCQTVSNVQPQRGLVATCTSRIYFNATHSDRPRLYILLLLLLGLCFSLEASWLLVHMRKGLNRRTHPKKPHIYQELKGLNGTRTSERIYFCSFIGYEDGFLPSFWLEALDPHSGSDITSTALNSSRFSRGFSGGVGSRNRIPTICTRIQTITVINSVHGTRAGMIKQVHC